MSGPMPFSQLDERSPADSSAHPVGPYVLLGILALFMVADQVHAGDLPGSSTWPCAGWRRRGCSWMFTLHPAWRVRPRPMAVFFTVLVVIMAVLVIRDPWFGFLTPAGYTYAFSRPARGHGGWPASPRWRSWRPPPRRPAWTGPARSASSCTCRPLRQRGPPVRPGLDGLEERHPSRAAGAGPGRGARGQPRLEATLAENAGLHEQLLTQAREAGILDERQRMAGEIHDTLAQGLTGIITQLQAAEQASGDPAGWRRHVAAATRLARESLSEARRSVQALRPEPLERARLE